MSRDSNSQMSWVLELLGLGFLALLFSLCLFLSIITIPSSPRAPKPQQRHRVTAPCSLQRKDNCAVGSRKGGPGPPDG